MHDCRQFWVEREMPEGRACLWRLGALKIWLIRADAEWRFALERGAYRDASEVSFVPFDVVPDTLSWRQTAFSKAPRVFSLHPLVPDRPVLIPLPGRVLLPPAEEAGFNSVISPWVEVRAGQGAGKTILGTVAAHEPRDAWVGTAGKGRLVYGASASAVRVLDELAVGRDGTAVEFRLRNTGAVPVGIDQICLDFRHASLYAGPRHLWASSATIDINGDSGCATAEFSGHAPLAEPSLRRLSPPLLAGSREAWPLEALLGDASDFHGNEGGFFV